MSWFPNSPTLQLYFAHFRYQKFENDIFPKFVRKIGKKSPLWRRPTSSLDQVRRQVGAGRRLHLIRCEGRPTPAGTHSQTLPLLPNMAFFRQIICLKIWLFLTNFMALFKFCLVTLISTYFCKNYCSKLVKYIKISLNNWNFVKIQWCCFNKL